MLYQLSYTPRRWPGYREGIAAAQEGRAPGTRRHPIETAPALP